MKIEVFSTNVQTPVQAAGIINELTQALKDAAVNFDLDDCDKILRVASKHDINGNVIAAVVTKHGFSCEVLSDEVCDLNSVLA